jgi:ABC-type glycerol-3-phosphate transport system substrate-binding protein
MKKILLLAALSLGLTGCASFDTGLPDGKAANFRYVRTGKFSSTTIEATNFDKTPERVKADRWNVKHSNAWIPNIEITAEGYERVLGAK